MRSPIIFVLLVFMSSLVLWVLYQPKPKINPSWMDHPDTQDQNLSNPSRLVSNRFPNGPSEADKTTPILIAVHGYTASTYEWDQLSDHLGKRSPILVSPVLLGGHGRSYQAFKKSTYKDWGQPIIDEYNKLVELGFTNISFIGASTGGALILNHFANGELSTTPPKHVFLIDSIVQPRNKDLFLAPYFGLFFKDRDTTNYKETQYNFPVMQAQKYSIRSYGSLSQLAQLCQRLKRTLQKGLSLPKGTQVHIYQSDKDATVDPNSATLIQNGLRLDNDNGVSIKQLDSDLHVFTNLQILAAPSDLQKQNQAETFEEIMSLLQY